MSRVLRGLTFLREEARRGARDTHLHPKDVLIIGGISSSSCTRAVDVRACGTDSLPGRLFEIVAMQ
jgi:hypothetical protein